MPASRRLVRIPHRPKPRSTYRTGRPERIQGMAPYLTYLDIIAGALADADPDAVIAIGDVNNTRSVTGTAGRHQTQWNTNTATDSAVRQNNAQRVIDRSQPGRQRNLDPTVANSPEARQFFAAFDLATEDGRAAARDHLKIEYKAGLVTMFEQRSSAVISTCTPHNHDVWPDRYLSAACPLTFR